MNAWQLAYADIEENLAKFSTSAVFFRGHSDATWKLSPGFARRRFATATHALAAERNSYFDFVTRAGTLLPDGRDSWGAAFAMQHHGLPRLLDWTETLGVAIYFALREGQGDAAIWLLNPFQLNAASMGSELLFHPHELKGTYGEFFIDATVAAVGDVVAISPLRHNPRVSQQRAGFTLHAELLKPLEELHPKAVRKITVPAAARLGGKRFLRHAGISEFSLFPDLDGLAREIKLEQRW
jgi:FRG domain